MVGCKFVNTSSSSARVSIPQAVGTIAIREKGIVFKPIGLISFNTASGRYYCNLTPVQPDHYVLHVVSIPQAVGTIAIYGKVTKCDVYNWFQYRKR